MSSKHVIILGAGPAGLSAAWELSREGARVDVIEMESQVGGLCRSTRKDGFIYDLGGHRFITKDSLVLTEVEELMGKELLVRPRTSKIYLRGKSFDYPLLLFDALRKMNPWISFKMGVDFFLTKIGAYSNMADVSFEDWVIKRFGKTMYDIYFEPYSRKLWGLPPNNISADWAAQRITLINITDVLLRALGKKKEMPKTYARQFLYPRNGIGQISELMAKEIEKHGGRIHLNAKVNKIVRKNGYIEEIIYEQNEKEKKISGDFIVSTIPLPEFVMSTSPRPEDRYIKVAEGMDFRSIRFLHISLNTDYVSENTWLYVPEEKYVFFRIQDRRNWSPTTVPVGKNALTLEIACNKNEPVYDAPDQEIFELCIKGLEDLGLITRGMVEGYFTERVEHAYPIYSLDYQEKINTAFAFLFSMKNLISVGRQGLYRYNNMDHSIKMGILTAKHIMHAYPRQKIFEIATEGRIFDWQDPGYHDGSSKIIE